MLIALHNAQVRICIPIYAFDTSIRETAETFAGVEWQRGKNPERESDLISSREKQDQSLNRSILTRMRSSFSAMSLLSVSKRSCMCCLSGRCGSLSINFLFHFSSSRSLCSSASYNDVIDAAIHLTVREASTPASEIEWKSRSMTRQIRETNAHITRLQDGWRYV